MTHPFSNVAFEHIVYIGAGQGEELKQLAQSLTAKHWSVIDGDENNTQQLTEVSESLQEQGVSINVQQKVVATNAEKVTWYNYNLAEFNGIHKASELTALFPGLKLISSESVTPAPLEDLLAQLNVTGDNNLLIIDVPAQGLELAKALSETPYKFVFNFMCVGSQSETLFESSNTAAELKSWFLENGYHTRNEEVDDPDFPKMHFALSHTEWKQANELKQAQEQIEKANAERDEVKAELEHANEAMHKRTEWARNLQAKLEQALAEKEKLAERAEKAEAQIEGLQASVKEVNEERDKAAANASNASKELEQLKQQLNDQTERTKTAENERDEALSRVSDTSKELAQANEEKQKQTEWAHSLQTKLEEAVAEKSKLAERAEKAEAQIEDLQTSFKEVNEELDKAAANASNASKELEQLKQQLNDQTERTKTAENERDEAVARASGTSKELAQANEEKQKHTDWAHNLKQQLDQTQAELKEQQRSAQLSTKLLAKVEADASELRERYAEKVKSEQELKDLIKELHAKLQAASHFYHKLEQEHPELLEKL